MFIPRPRTHSIKFGSAGFSDLAMAEKVLPPIVSKVVRGLVRDLELLNVNLGSHWKLTHRKTPPYAWMSLLKLQFTLTLLMCCTTASKYGYIGQRMDIPNLVHSALPAAPS